jgi:integrase
MRAVTTNSEQEIHMTIRQNTKFRKQIARLCPATTEEIRELFLKCEGDPGLRVAGNIIRAVANTGIRGEELKSLRISDIDATGEWLTVARPRNMRGDGRVVPIFARTYAALRELHGMNPLSEFILGDSPRTRIDQTIRILKIIAPQLARTRLWIHSIRLNYETRMYAAGVPSGIVKYLLGRESLGEALKFSSLTRDEVLQIVRRTFERFMHEL